MSAPAGETDADHVLRIALTHPECRGGAALNPVGDRQRLSLDMNVEMPLHMSVDGISSTGVRTTEPVLVKLAKDHPWSSPTFYLRDDFPRHFPHLQPGAKTTLPRPCLVDGSQDEFYLQFGLVEAGIFNLVDQLAIWLRKAAISDLIDERQGWEPALRHDCQHVIQFDAAKARALVKRDGGWQAWRAEYIRRGDDDARVDAGIELLWISSSGEPTPLRNKVGDECFAPRGKHDNVRSGNTVVGLLWPDKLPNGTLFVNAHYLPEDVTNFEELRTRACELGCGRSFDAFIGSLERRFDGIVRGDPVPIGIVLCARRPIHLIGSGSNIELLPYALEVHAGKARSSLFLLGDAEPVSPALHYQSLSADLLREVSAAPARPAIAILGCGSVGSKMALHTARSGQEIAALSDESWLRPHNLGRHALLAGHSPGHKAEALADEIEKFGDRPLVYKGDLTSGLAGDDLAKVIPKRAEAAINTTASLAVREALVAAQGRTRARLLEVGLFGRGRGAYLLADGAGHNPSHSDLMAELYAINDDDEMRDLMFDPKWGLTEVQVGQGCGSLTMPMTDARVSAMAARLSEEVGDLLDLQPKDGIALLGKTSADGRTSGWRRFEVPAFTVVPIEGTVGWQLRLSSRVISRIKADIAHWQRVETGGLMIGVSSARLKTVTVVDVLDAPQDSQRTATLFVLGKEGLQDAILRRHNESGESLYDVGTWHSHLADEGPSSVDWATATDLASVRPPPSVLLIATPKGFYALSAAGGGNKVRGAKRN